ncbi:bifunctional serine/threonine-protein kinase/formylglycine-generating enzyme family protein [Zavarzinella formosa]|uniref:bifunctional serine/threonine-protein kinase/formylglycine-generating enzyme family protein n=1 Tax=Zavarzinella formosa TaxID=360055 RepID=UPI0002DDA1A5|nr:bifunctional serine/threonine-protein kinase/formylglycine-generating enzyme family protein [Zavarzinella formosa]
MTPGSTPEQAVKQFLAARSQNPNLTPEDFCRSASELSPEAARVLQSINFESGVAGTFTQPRSAGSASSVPSSAPEPTKLGAYAIRRKLGQGGMGTVYLGMDSRLDREVAVKVMRPEISANPEARARFLREAKAMAAVKHDHVATIYAADQEPDGTTWLAMELLEGESLEDSLKAGRPLDWKGVMRIGREIALGLAAAHAKKMIHRDIKPANVWLESPGGRVKILDFGLVRPTETDSDMTGVGALIGTPAYMAPEQADGGPIDHRCDLFSLGVLLYRLATGKSPFIGLTVLATLINVTTEEPERVMTLRPDCPPGLAVLIHRLLEKNRDSRPPTAGAVAEELQRLLHDDSQTPLMLPPKSEREPVRAGRSKAWLIAAPVLLLLLVGGFIVIKQMSKDGTEPEAKTKIPDQPVAASADNKDKSKAVVFPDDKGKSPTLAIPDNKDKPPIGAAPDDKGKPPVVVAPEEKSKPVTALLGNPKTAPLPPTFANSLGMEFVKVPKGAGWLGGGDGAPGHTKAEFARDFYIGKYEVTQEEWTKITGKNPSEFSRTGDSQVAVKDIKEEDLKRFPAENMSWDETRAFLTLLNKKDGQKGWIYRLPTSQEWEYACRGGPQADKSNSEFDFYFAKPTNQLAPEQANVFSGPEEGLQRPAKVGSYKPNPLGLYDMVGNVNEWCDNAYSPGSDIKATKGGGWVDIAASCRCSFLGACGPADRRSTLGCRLVIVPAD